MAPLCFKTVFILVKLGLPTLTFVIFSAVRSDPGRLSDLKIGASCVMRQSPVILLTVGTRIPLGKGNALTLKHSLIRE